MPGIPFNYNLSDTKSNAIYLRQVFQKETDNDKLSTIIFLLLILNKPQLFSDKTFFPPYLSLSDFTY